MLHTTAPGNILAAFHGRPISQRETHDGENQASRTMPHLNPHPRLPQARTCFFLSGYALIHLDTDYHSINDPNGRPFRVPIRQNAQVCTT